MLPLSPVSFPSSPQLSLTVTSVYVWVMLFNPVLFLLSPSSYPSLPSSHHHRSFPGELLHHDSDKSPVWSPGLPSLYLQWAGCPAAGRWTGTLTCVPVWGPEWQTCPRGLPIVQRHQPGWWQVSNQQQPVCDWLRWHDWGRVGLSGWE